MIGTLTVSQAIIGFLGFLGINNFKELTNVLYGFVGLKSDGIEVIQTDNDVEIRKNGKLIVKFDVDSIEEMFENDTIATTNIDFTYNTYEDYIISHWDKLAPKPKIIDVWMVNDVLMMRTRYSDTSREEIVKIVDGDNAKERIGLLATTYK